MEKEPKTAGRPTKKTPETVKVLLKVLEDGLPREIAIKYAKISKPTFYDWIKKDPDFLTQVEFAECKAGYDLMKSVKKRDPWKLLKNKFPEHYRDKIEQEHTGGEQPIKMILEDYRGKDDKQDT